MGHDLKAGNVPSNAIKDMPLKRFPTDSSSEAALIALNNKENHIKRCQIVCMAKEKEPI